SISVPTGFSLANSNNIPGTLAPNGTATFTIQMNTNSQGAKSGNITFSTGDPGNTTFSIAASGTVNAAAHAVQVLQRGTTNLANGASAAFGTRNLGDTPPAKSFTVKNIGGQNLTLGSVSVPTGYSLVSPTGIPGTLAPNATATFSVQMNTPSA